MNNNQRSKKIGGMAALVSSFIKKALAGKDPATIHDPHAETIRLIGKPGKGVHHVLTANGWVERSEYYRTLQDAQEDTTHE